MTTKLERIIAGTPGSGVTSGHALRDGSGRGSTLKSAAGFRPTEGKRAVGRGEAERIAAGLEGRAGSRQGEQRSDGHLNDPSNAPMSAARVAQKLHEAGFALVSDERICVIEYGAMKKLRLALRRVERELAGSGGEPVDLATEITRPASSVPLKRGPGNAYVALERTGLSSSDSDESFGDTAFVRAFRDALEMLRARDELRRIEMAAEAGTLIIVEPDGQETAP